MGAQALLGGWSDGVATKLNLGWHTPSVPWAAISEEVRAAAGDESPARSPALGPAWRY